MKNNDDFNVGKLSKDDLSVICNELKKMLFNVKAFLTEKGYSEDKIRDIVFGEVQKKTKIRMYNPKSKTREEYKDTKKQIEFELYYYMTRELGIDPGSVDLSLENVDEKDLQSNGDKIV